MAFIYMYIYVYIQYSQYSLNWEAYIKDKHISTEMFYIYMFLLFQLA